MLAFHLATAFAQHEQFDEDLHLRPLRDGRLLSRFSFTTLLKGTAPRDPQQLSADDEGMCSTCIPHLLDFSFYATAQHYTLFPLALGQVLREYAVTELHLTLNAGKWNYEAWGYPDEPGVGTGAELWAWMGDSVPTSCVFSPLDSMLIVSLLGKD